MRSLANIRPVSFLSAALLLVSWTAQAPGRELHVPAEDMIPVELANVGINSLTGSPIVVLRDPASGSTVPVVIGPPEAHAILMALNEIQVPRPMTHDLISNILSAAGVRLERVLIDALVDGTYLGALELWGENGEAAPIYVDARPSDSLAIAVREKAAIFIAPAVLDAARQLDLEASFDETFTALGITVISITGPLRETLGLEDRAGVLVSRSEGPAAQAGVPAGALILSVNGHAPGSPGDFLDLVEGTPPTEDVRIVYWIDGEEHEVLLTQEPPDPELIQEAQPKLRV